MFGKRKNQQMPFFRCFFIAEVAKNEFFAREIKLVKSFELDTTSRKIILQCSFITAETKDVIISRHTTLLHTAHIGAHWKNGRDLIVKTI